MKTAIVILGLLLLASIVTAQVEKSIQDDYEDFIGQEVYSFDLVSRVHVPQLEGTYFYYIARSLEEYGEYIERWMVCYYYDGVKSEYRGRWQIGVEEIQ